MPEILRNKKHQQHTGLLLRKGLVVASRKSSAAFPYTGTEQAAPLTPLPTWKLYENPSYQTLAVAAASAVPPITASMKREHDDNAKETNEDEEEVEENMWAQKNNLKEAGCKDTATGSASRICLISARKLAASLWEELQEQGQGDSHSTICDFSESSPCSHLQRRPSSLSTSESPDSHSFKVVQAPTASQQIHRNSQLVPSVSPPLKAIMPVQPSSGGIASGHESLPRVSISSGKDAREELGALSNNYEHSDVTTSCDYMEVSFRSEALEKTQVDSPFIESPLSVELKRALSKVQQVEAAQISARKEVDCLLRKCADEIFILRSKEQEKIHAAVFAIAEQLEKERKVKRDVELENRKLASSLADANKAVLAAKEELQKERKARQLMEDVCDELAKEIGEDKAEAEELKRELAKVRDEIEEERRTFQVTEAWREERVQMKLSEAKLELEERCVALDELKMELELFLKRVKVDRVEAYLYHGGEGLRGAIERLHEETSESAFFLKDARGFLSPVNNAIASDNWCSLKSSSSSNKDRSIWHVNSYDSTGVDHHLHSAERGQNDFGWNIESDRLARQQCSWLVSTKAHMDENDEHWISCMRASRSKAGMKSYRSKLRGLNSLDDRGLAQDSGNDLERRSRAFSDGSGIGGDYSSGCEFSNEEEGTDFDNENGHLRESDIGFRSASEVEEESRWQFSPKFNRKVANRSLEVLNVKRRHGAARMKQCHGGKGPTRAEQCYNGDLHFKYAFARTKQDSQLTEDDNGFSPLTGYSPAYKGHMPSPDFLAQKGTNKIKHSASLFGRKTVYNSVDWSKPYKRNSLQAKLLLED